MSAKAHTQKTNTYFGSDLTSGMVWVDGYGRHYTIVEVANAFNTSIVDGFLSTDYDYTHSTLRLRPVGPPAPDLTVLIDNGDEFDILPV